MSSRKRAHASSTPSPSAAKQPRVGEGTRATPVTAPRPHGRVVLNVGGQVFQSSRTTLEGSSSYFRSLLSRWDEDAEEPVFIDCDADAFGVLLSHMRIASNIILPKDEEELGARVLLLAEYLGMESLLAQVKAKAYRNMHPDQEEKNDGDDLAAAFDAEVGTLQQAIDSKVLPARFFAPAPKPPPKRVIKNLIPAPPGYTALFSDDKFLDGVAKVQDEDGEEYNADCVSRDVLSFAVVELQDGTTGVEAIVQRSLQSTTVEYERAINHTDVDTHQQLHHHLQFASEVDWEHYLIVPPPASARMLPVAPASIRATFAKPAITRADTGKRVNCLREWQRGHRGWRGAFSHLGRSKAASWYQGQGDCRILHRRCPSPDDVGRSRLYASALPDRRVQSNYQRRCIRRDGPGRRRRHCANEVLHRRFRREAMCTRLRTPR
jgi:hypothetical protein